MRCPLAETYARCRGRCRSRSSLTCTFRFLTISSQPSTVSQSLLSGAFAEKLCDVEVNKVGVMKNYRFDRALDLVAFVAVGGDDVEHFAGKSVLIGERHAAERVAHLLPEFSLGHFARGVFVVLKWFAHIGQERTGDEIVALHRNATPERFL